MSESIFSIDGVNYNDIQYYRPVSFGDAYLKNGSFEELKDDGHPVGWTLSPGVVVECSETGANRLSVPKGLAAWQTMWHGPLRQADRPRKFVYTFRACGSGEAVVSFRRYRDSYDATAKGHSRREILTPNGRGEKYELSSVMQTFVGEYEVPAGEWDSIMISAKGGDMVLDDVAVVPME